MRGFESKVRKFKYTSCFTSDNKFTPLFDLTNEMEDAIYEKYNIPVPKIYDHLNRTGCMGCPYSKKNVNNVEAIEKELSLLDKAQHDFVCEYFKESYQVLNVNIE